MIIQLTRADGTILDAQIAPPTMAKRDLFRAVAKRHMKEADALDARYKGAEFSVDYVSVQRKGFEIERLNEQFTAEYFKTVVNTGQIPDADRKYFELYSADAEVVEFWENQDLQAMNSALMFFRENFKERRSENKADGVS